MATTTTNLGLTKPAYADAADIAIINSNMDIIDSNIKSLQDMTATHISQIGSLQDSVSDLQSDITDLQKPGSKGNLYAMDSRSPYSYTKNTDTNVAGLFLPSGPSLVIAHVRIMSSVVPATGWAYLNIVADNDSTDSELSKDGITFQASQEINLLSVGFINPSQPSNCWAHFGANFNIDNHNYDKFFCRLQAMKLYVNAGY